MPLGHSTWLFQNPPTILTTGTVAGPFEAQGKIAAAIDKFHDDLWLQPNSFEQAQQRMMEEATDIAVKQAQLQNQQLGFFISGDLLNHITPTPFAATPVRIPD